LNLPVMIAASFKRTVQRKIGKDIDQPKPCRYLSQSGCTLTHEQRPMLCVSWFCPKYIFGMNPSSLDCLERPLREISLIHHQIAEAVSSKDKAP
jgi:Fe-S-cluster containining protein